MLAMTATGMAQETQPRVFQQIYNSAVKTANDPGEALSLPGVQERVDDFAARVKKTLLSGAE